MNYTGRTILSAVAALTLLGAGSGVALADDKHGPDDGHNEDKGDGVCTFLEESTEDGFILIRPDLDDPDCAALFE